MILAYVAISFHKAGDHAGARNVIEQARRLASELPEHREKEKARWPMSRGHWQKPVTSTVHFSLREAWTSTAHKVRSRRSSSPSRRTNRAKAGFPSAGSRSRSAPISRKLKDREAARIALPKLVQAATAIGDPLIQARTLSMLAHLQAKAGDVRRMPSVRSNRYRRSSARTFRVRVTVSTTPSSRHLGDHREAPVRGGRKGPRPRATTPGRHLVSSHRNRGSEGRFADCDHSKTDRLQRPGSGKILADGVDFSRSATARAAPVAKPRVAARRPRSKPAMLTAAEETHAIHSCVSGPRESQCAERPRGVVQEEG